MYTERRIWADQKSPAFKWWCIVTLVVGVVGPPLRKLAWPRLLRALGAPAWVRPLFPDTVLIGLGQFAPANAYSVTLAQNVGRRP